MTFDDNDLKWLNWMDAKEKIMAIRYCPKCGQPIKTGDKVELLVYAIYKEVPSKIAYSIEKPFDAEPESLAHLNCAE